MKQRLFKSLLAVVALLPLSAWALDTNDDGVYEIGSAADLTAFASLVNSGTTGANAILTDDINMSNVTFTPIGNKNYIYTGTFDGDGHVISNLSVSGTTYKALIGYTGDGAVVKNLGLKDVTIKATATVQSVTIANYSAALVGYASGVVTITDCYVDGGAISGGSCIGGLIGSTDVGSTAILTNCYNTASVTSVYRCVGGLIGNALSTSILTNCYNTGAVEALYFVGGLIGYAGTSTIIDSYNAGTVTATGNNSDYLSTYTGNEEAADAGGLIGMATSSPTITGCYNTGTITSDYKNIGGLVGYASSSSSFTDCYNAGAVTSTSTNAGGLIGYPRTAVTLEKCYNTGAITASSYAGGLISYADESTAPTLTNCYNLGDVTATDEDDNIYNCFYAGGMVGYKDASDTSYKLTLTNCYSTGTITSTSTYCNRALAYISGSGYTVTNCYSNGGYDSHGDYKTKDQFASGEVCYLLNGSSSSNVTWYQNLGEGDDAAEAYPVLVGESVVYKVTTCQNKSYSNYSSGHVYVNHICKNCNAVEDNCIYLPELTSTRTISTAGDYVVFGTNESIGDAYLYITASGTVNLTFENATAKDFSNSNKVFVEDYCTTLNITYVGENTFEGSNCFLAVRSSGYTANISGEGSMDITTKEDKHYGFYNAGTLNFNGGTITYNTKGSSAHCIYNNGGTLKVNDGKLIFRPTGEGAYCIYNYNSGTMTVNGGTFDMLTTATNGRGIQNEGTMTINDCDLTFSAAGKSVALYTRSGATSTYNGGTYNITMKADTGRGLQAYNTGTQKISGGTFTIHTYGTDSPALFNESSGNTTTVTGGTFYLTTEGLGSYPINCKDGTMTIGDGVTITTTSTNTPAYYAGGTYTNKASMTSTLNIDDTQDYSYGYSWEASNVNYPRSQTANWATISLPYDCAVPEDVTAYGIDEVSDDLVLLTKVESLSANTGYLIYMEEPSEVDFNATSATVQASADCLTTATSTSTAFMPVFSSGKLAASDNIYKLVNTDANPYFNHSAGSATLAPFKSFLYVPESSSSAPQRLTISFGNDNDDDTTAIATALGLTTTPDAIYNLAGQKVETTTRKGLYIINGKKVVK